jgi:hypothetical protein
MTNEKLPAILWNSTHHVADEFIVSLPVRSGKNVATKRIEKKD